MNGVAPPIAEFNGHPLVPKRFVDFAVWVGLTLTTAQTILCLVAFDGFDPVQLPPRYRDMCRRLFGDVDTIPDRSRRVVVAVCGGRAGKSRILCALRALHLALTVPTKHRIAPGEMARATIVAPDIDLALQTLAFVRGAINEKHELLSRVVKDIAGSIEIVGVDGAVIRIEALAATVGGLAARGKWHVAFIMDEAAFFRSRSYAVNDLAVYRPARTRILTGGQLIVASTPWLEDGLLFDLHTKNHGHPDTAISAHAPTMLMREGDAELELEVDIARAEDAENAAREFDGEFLPPGTSVWFDPRSIQDAIDESLVLPFASPIGATLGFGGDFGFAKNSSALAVSAWEGDRVTLCELEEIIPTRAAPLVPSVVVARFAGIVKARGGRAVMADLHYRESIQEHLRASGLSIADAPAGNEGKGDVHIRARELLHAQGRVRLPNHQRLIRQLREVVAKPQPGGGMSFSSPKWASGAHGDLAAAWMLSVYPTGAHRTTLPGLPPTKDQRAAAEQAEIFKRAKAKWGKKPGQPWWKAKP